MVSVVKQRNYTIAVQCMYILYKLYGVPCIFRMNHTKHHKCVSLMPSTTNLTDVYYIAACVSVSIKWIFSQLMNNSTKQLRLIFIWVLDHNKHMFKRWENFAIMRPPSPPRFYGWFHKIPINHSSGITVIRLDRFSFVSLLYLYLYLFIYNNPKQNIRPTSLVLTFIVVVFVLLSPFLLLDFYCNASKI